MKKNSLLALVLMFLCGLPLVAFAGQPTLFCGTDTVTQCTYDYGCRRTTAREVNLPRFINVNLRKKVLSEVNVESPRVTDIKQLEEMDDRYILQGAENGRAWNMVIRKISGEMSATVSDDLLGFVVFGMCTKN